MYRMTQRNGGIYGRIGTLRNHDDDSNGNVKKQYV